MGNDIVSSEQAIDTAKDLPKAASEELGEVREWNNVVKQPRPTEEEEVGQILAICDIVTRHGDYVLSLPVKTYQANIAILSALKNMEAKIGKLE